MNIIQIKQVSSTGSLLENVEDWMRIKEDIESVTSDIPEEKKKKMDRLLDAVGKLDKGRPYAAHILGIGNSAKTAVSVLKNEESSAVEKASAILNMASGVAAFIPTAGPAISTVLQLVSSLLTMGIEAGPSITDQIGDIVSSQFALAEYKSIKDELNVEKVQYDNAQGYIQSYESISQSDEYLWCLTSAAKDQFNTVLNENNMKFFAIALGRLPDMIKDKSKHTYAFSVLTGICEVATLRYDLLLPLLGIAQTEIDNGCNGGQDFYNKIYKELYNDLPKSVGSAMDHLRDPNTIKGNDNAIQFTEKFFYDRNKAEMASIQLWLNRKMIKDTSRFKSFVFTAQGTNKFGTWNDEWKICQDKYTALVFDFWVDDNGGTDKAGLSQMSMKCSGVTYWGNTYTLGTKPWGTHKSYNCWNQDSSQVAGIKACLPNRGTDNEGIYVQPSYSKAPPRHDDVGLMTMGVKCGNGDEFYISTSKDEGCRLYSCPSGTYICAFNARYAPWEGDDTGISNAVFACCDGF